MTNPREDILMAGLNVRMAQRKREARWWWLRDWRDFARGASVGLSMGGVMWIVLGSGWFRMEGVPPTRFWVMLVFLSLTGGNIVSVLMARQRATIARLEERIKSLEERLPAGDGSRK